MIKYLLSKHEALTYSNTTNMYICVCVCVCTRLHIKETASDFVCMYLYAKGNCQWLSYSIPEYMLKRKKLKRFESIYMPHS